MTMLRVLLLALACLSCADPAVRDRSVVLIVTDGLRWQEVFSGAERGLIGPEGGVGDTTALLREFWRESARERREVLLPFLWGTVAREGQILGNPATGSAGTVTNGLKFSYPGYNEMLTGAADPRIDSNSHGPNENTTVFAWLAGQDEFRGRVASVATWGVFRDIFAAPGSGVDVHAGWAPPFTEPSNERQAQINAFYQKTTRLWPDNTLDVLAHETALELVRTAKPRVLFIGYGETDEWAHARRYDLTLHTARQVDALIGELWAVMQSMPEYRGATTFIITTDHGRGDGPDWTRHGESVVGAEYVWMAIIGPETPGTGERADAPFTQAQVAATLAAALGKEWASANPAAAKAVPGAIGQPAPAR